jgi:hypothetical protein
MATLNLPPVPSGDMLTNPQEWVSYSVKLREFLEYGFTNLDSENFSAAQRNSLINIENAAAQISNVMAQLQYKASLQSLNLLMDSTDGLVTIYYSEPASPRIGDLWFDSTSTPAIVWKREESSWADVTSVILSAALTAAADARAIADGKIQSFYQDTPPEGLVTEDEGDLWFDTAHGNALSRWDGTDWISADNEIVNNVYITSEGVNVKSIDGAYRGVFTSTGLIFYQNDVWIGEFSNNRMRTHRADVMDIFSMGDTIYGGYYDEIMSTVGGVARKTVKYREG